MSQPGMVSHGMPPRENETQRDIADLQRQMRHLHGMIAQVITGQGGITVNGGSIEVVDGGQVTFLYGDFISKYLKSQGYTNVTVRGLQANTQGGDLIFESFSDPTYAPTGQFQVGIAGAANLPYFDVYSYNADIEASNAVNIVGGSSANIKLSNAIGVQLSAGSAGFTLSGVATSAATANLVLDASTGALTRSTSSRRYKQDVTDADLDTDALLQLTPRRFRAKAEVERDGDDAPEHVGFIAEEAADLGLDAFVTCDEDGPEAFSYAGYVVGLQAIVRRQAEQIADLTARLERLEKAEPAEEC